MNLGAFARSELQSHCRLSAGEMVACSERWRGLIIRASLVSVSSTTLASIFRSLWSRIGYYLL